jgi:hypothetical protein
LTRLTLISLGDVLDVETHFRRVRTMKRAELLCAGMVVAAVVAVSDATAHADIVTLQVSGTLSPLAPLPDQPPLSRAHPQDASSAARW